MRVSAIYLFCQETAYNLSGPERRGFAASVEKLTLKEPDVKIAAPAVNLGYTVNYKFQLNSNYIG